MLADYYQLICDQNIITQTNQLNKNTLHIQYIQKSDQNYQLNPFFINVVLMHQDIYTQLKLSQYHLQMKQPNSLESEKFIDINQVEKLAKTINDSAYSFTQIEQKIKSVFKTIIEKISSVQQQVMLQFHDLFLTKAYSSQERQILSLLSPQQLTTDLLTKVNSNVFNRKILQKKIHQITSKIDQLTYKFTQKIKYFGEQLRQKLLQLQNRYTNKQQPMNNLFYSSQIVCSKQHEVKLFKFFSQSIIDTQLLYLASQNGFQKAAFHKLCDHISSILVLIKTENGKIIGGYTPLAFISTHLWLNDPTSQSFLFSLTQGDKFDLIKPQNAIWREPDNQKYIFGFGHDLNIANKANENENSFINFSEEQRSQWNAKYLIHGC